MINWSIGTSDDGQVIDDDHDADDHYHDDSYDGGDDDVLSPQRSGLRIELQNAAVVATAHISFTSPNISTPRSL